MTPQEIFDTVATHLFTQGKKAVNYKGSCVYRAGDGSKCAVGVLIPDDHYNVKMETGGIHTLLAYHSDEIPSFFKSNKDLLVDLQHVHDEAYPVCKDKVWDSTESMKKALASLATAKGLDPSVLEGLKFSDR
jgi:hypothetical protein